MLYLVLIINLIFLMGALYLKRIVKNDKVSRRAFPLLVSLLGLITFLFRPVIGAVMYGSALDAPQPGALEDVAVLAMELILEVCGIYLFVWGIARVFRRKKVAPANMPASDPRGLQ